VEIVIYQVRVIEEDVTISLPDDASMDLIRTEVKAALRCPDHFGDEGFIQNTTITIMKDGKATDITDQVQP
jgi:hypothetical protein